MAMVMLGVDLANYVFALHGENAIGRIPTTRGT